MTLPKLTASFHRDMVGVKMSFLYGRLGAPDSVSVGISRLSPWTAEEIAKRCNEYDALIEALKAAETRYQVGILKSTNEEIERVHTLRRECLKRAGEL